MQKYALPPLNGSRVGGVDPALCCSVIFYTSIFIVRAKNDQKYVRGGPKRKAFRDCGRRNVCTRVPQVKAMPRVCGSARLNGVDLHSQVDDGSNTLNVHLERTEKSNK